MKFTYFSNFHLNLCLNELCYYKFTKYILHKYQNPYTCTNYFETGECQNNILEMDTWKKDASWIWHSHSRFFRVSLLWWLQDVICNLISHNFMSSSRSRPSDFHYNWIPVVKKIVTINSKIYLEKDIFCHGSVIILQELSPNILWLMLALLYLLIT